MESQPNNVINSDERRDRRHWHGEAAEAAVRITELQMQIEQEEERRRYALSMLGMVAVEPPEQRYKRKYEDREDLW